MIKEYAGQTEILIFDWNFIDSHMYVIPDDNEALIIDPVLTSETEKFFTEKKFNKLYIFLTHEHFDHINGLQWFQNNFNTKTICNRDCFKNIQLASKNLSDKSEVIRMFNSNVAEKSTPVDAFTCNADIYFDDNYQLIWHSNKIELVSTPGHSPGSICIIYNESFLFSGDTLLEFPTITRLPGGNKCLFCNSTVPYLKNISNKIKKVFPGHGIPGNMTDFLSSCI